MQREGTTTGAVSLHRPAMVHLALASAALEMRDRPIEYGRGNDFVLRSGRELSTPIGSRSEGHAVLRYLIAAVILLVGMTAQAAAQDEAELRAGRGQSW